MKFQVGEIAVFVGGINNSNHGSKFVGQEVEIICIDPAPGIQTLRGIRGRLNRKYGYIVWCPAINDWGGCNHYQLRKRRPPEEKGSWTEIEKITGWHPNKTSAE